MISQNPDYTPNITDPEQDDDAPVCPDCPHTYGQHNDLQGCAVTSCPCSESKATLQDQE